MDYFDLKTIDDYRSLLDKITSTKKLETEVLNIDNSYGRFCAKDIKATGNLPGFRRSQVDGYAVIAKDSFSATSSPVYLKCLGTLTVDEDASLKSIKSGECYRISTGGMIPENADSIVMIEYTNMLNESTIEINRAVSPLENVILSDEDIKIGEKIIDIGSKITSYHIGILSSLGIVKIEVFKEITIGIISTGDEIIDISQILSPGKMRDVNSHTIFSLCKKYGTSPERYGIVKDDSKELFEKLKLAITESDIVLISGGSSVGTRDLTLDIIKKFENSEILLHGIAIKPGKPTIIARIDKKFVFGLPGQVTSSIVSFFLTVLPLIKRLYKNNDPLHFLDVIAGSNIKSTLGREEWLKCSIKEKGRKSPTHTVYPVYSKSGVLGSFIKSGGFLVIPANREGIKAGERGKFLSYDLIL